MTPDPSEASADDLLMATHAVGTATATPYSVSYALAGIYAERARAKAHGCQGFIPVPGFGARTTCKRCSQPLEAHLVRQQ